MKPPIKSIIQYHIRKVRLEETDSTNHYAASLSAPDVDDFVIVTADSQTAGRGQGGNSWESEQGKNLTFSLVCAPLFLPPNRQFLLLQVCALTIRDVVAMIVDNVTIKWPNDIYINDRKVSGTLIECEIEHGQIKKAVLGVGLNINQCVFKSDAPNPTSLSLETGRLLDRESILDDIIVRFSDYFNMMRRGLDVKERYMQALYRREGIHVYHDKGGDFEASIADVRPGGELVLNDMHRNERIYRFKEVQFRL